jgi:predicted transcriptional regulator
LDVSEPVDDTLECMECGRWFRSVANHVYVAHGLRSDEYRLRHDIAMSDPLSGADTTARRRESAYLRLESDPDLLARMRASAGTGARGDHARAEARAAAMGRRRRAVEAEWEERLAQQGWTSWQDAADWAIDQNVGWAEVAALFAMSVTPVQVRAKLAGVPPLDRRITAVQDQMLALARDWFARSGTLFRTRPRELSVWLSHQRRLAARGVRRRVHDELDRIDPDWELDPALRTNPPCVVPGCQTPHESRGLCRIHYHRKLEKERRDAVIDAAEQIECLECGERFRSVGTHVRQAHGLSAAEYRVRHGIADTSAMNAAAVLAQRRQHSTTPEAKEQLRQASIARWGGTAEQLWAQRFERAGWSGWEDAVAWAMAHNKGWNEVADRLGSAHTRARERGRSAGVEILPPLTDKQLQFLELARAHAAEHGDLARPRPQELAVWLSGVRQAEKKARTQSRCYLALDEIDPEWRL